MTKVELVIDNEILIFSSIQKATEYILTFDTTIKDKQQKQRSKLIKYCNLRNTKEDNDFLDKADNKIITNTVQSIREKLNNRWNTTKDNPLYNNSECYGTLKLYGKTILYRYIN